MPRLCWLPQQGTTTLALSRGPRKWPFRLAGASYLGTLAPRSVFQSSRGGQENVRELELRAAAGRLLADFDGGGPRRVRRIRPGADRLGLRAGRGAGDAARQSDGRLP